MRWADLDLLGHVSNVVYVDYLQEARVDMLRTHAPDSRADDLAEGVVVVRHEVSYRSSLTFRFRPVSIECWVTEIRAASFTLAYEVFDETEDGRQVYLRASTVLTPYVFATERPRRLRPEEQEALVRFLEDAEPVRTSRSQEVRREGASHYPVHVRFSDVDVYRHVNNVKYFEYLQEGRVSMLRDAGQAADDERRLEVVVAQTNVDYRLPILFREQPYDCWTWVTHVGSSSVALESAICDGDAVLSRAEVVIVNVDPASMRPAPIQDGHRAALVKFMGA
ncbi:thioesterase [Nocardioides gansuensis]|uniref:Thioesterase n=2 Tax=Nocardioides gansuensis TaxID=2138300 RepID=A0A2T8F5N0_9ACTN|nr:thioesterase [Nocardioides gansuensis]